MDQSARDHFREHHFSETIELSESTREVLEIYSHIPPDEVMPHVYAIREKAFAIHPYPCIGMGRFLDLAIGKHALYPEILDRLKNEHQTFLDVGCAFAQDIRRLVADGVDSRSCFGSDLLLDFIDLGYELFRDRETLQSEFIAADIFDAQSPLSGFHGHFDIIGASSFFHLFPLGEQKQAALRVAELLKPQAGSLVVGRQMGNTTPGEVERRAEGGTRYRHTIETWRQLWEEVGKQTGVEYEVKGGAKILAELGISRWGETATFMEFTVRRL